MLGAIEGGGTKFVCAVSDLELNIIDKIIIETKSPKITLSRVFDFFSNHKIKSLGLGSFGPIDINPKSNQYGFITSTPKLEWKNFNILQSIKDKISPKVALNTDVNVAAYAEFKRGAAIGKDSCVYLTIGTGIGGGVIINRNIVNNQRHPELVHIFVNRKKDDTFSGNCPYHKDCLEGLASGPAIIKRWNETPSKLPDNHIAWEFEAYYLAQAIANYTLTIAPELIILGGGVMNNVNLLNKIKSQFVSLINNYFDLPNVDQYIVTPALGNEAGIIGGLLIAKELLETKESK